MFARIMPAAASAPLPFSSPRGMFASRPRREVLNQAAPRPSEVEAAATGPSGGFADAFAPYAVSTQTPGIGDGVREQRESMNAERNGGGFPQLQSAVQAARQSGGPVSGPLGGSMRQQFDYDAALEALAGDQRKPKAWQYVVAGTGDALRDAGEDAVLPSLVAQRDAVDGRRAEAQQQLMEWQYRDWARQNEADLGAAAPFTIGRDRVMYDPATGEANTIYDGAEDFELYAQELGLEPGSDEYFKAVEDYVLRSSGPSAFDRDVQMDDHRTGNDEQLERLRFGNRSSLESQRQGNRRGMVDYRNANPAPSRSTGGSRRATLPVVRTPAEARRLPSGTRFKTPDGKVKVVP